ncbi:DUF7002 family protein [Flavitalea antarctica]
MLSTTFIEKIPFLYHLTDVSNLPYIVEKGALLSTEELIKLANPESVQTFVSTRRAEHTTLQIGDATVRIRDQRPLNKALDKCLTDGWTREDFIRHLNCRVFMWPNLKRLNIHFGRYAHEKPVILRFRSKEVLELNRNIQLSRINSGATRPSGTLGGRAAARGKDTFVQLQNYDLQPATIAEVTFPRLCVIPSTFLLGQHPAGPWKPK